jgi:peptidoglycan/LPS O-acetylase OafA/YrhL
MTFDFFLDKFKRTTSNKSYIKEIEGLRFVAIFFVVLSHIITHMVREMNLKVDGSNFLYFIYSNGGFGVNLFFSLSGFILAIPFIKSFAFNEGSVSIKNYFLRRITRLEPPFIISLILFFILYVYFKSDEHAFEHLFYSLTYSHYIVYNTWSPINPITWSLETEIQFYVIAPIIFYLLFKPQKTTHKLLVFFLLLIGAFLFFSFFSETLKTLHLNKSLLRYFNFFLIGAISGYYYSTKLQNIIVKNFFYDLLGIAALSTIILTHHLPYNIFYPLQVLSCFLLIVSSFKGIYLNKVAVSRTMGAGVRVDQASIRAAQ